MGLFQDLRGCRWDYSLSGPGVSRTAHGLWQGQAGVRLQGPFRIHIDWPSLVGFFPGAPGPKPRGTRISSQITSGSTAGTMSCEPIIQRMGGCDFLRGCLCTVLDSIMTNGTVV